MTNASNINTVQIVWEGIPPSYPMLRPTQVLAATGLARTTMYDLIARGQFPPFLRIAPRTSAMPEAWLQAYLQACHPSNA